MSVKGVSEVVTGGYMPVQTAVAAAAQEDTKTADTKKTDSAKSDVYDKSTASKSSDDTDSVKKTYKRDNATIEQLKADAERRSQQLRSLVEKMLVKQGQTFNNSTDMYQLLREGKLKVDPETAAQAQKDIAEDGYWGVEQTSDRLVSFAKALSGGDPSKADELMAAVEKGFKQATKAWGGELPDISKRTLDTTLDKMKQWKNGTENTEGSVQS